MLVQFVRKWFGPDGKLYGENGAPLQEVPEDFRDQLPADAVVMTDEGSLPSDAVQTKPGFGAKPEHEQLLDQIPGAAPTHQIRRASALGRDIPGPKRIDLEGDAIVAKKAFDDRIAAQDERIAEKQGAVVAGIEAAKEMAQKMAEGTGDPSKIAQAEVIDPGTASGDPHHGSTTSDSVVVKKEPIVTKDGKEVVTDDGKSLMTKKVEPTGGSSSSGKKLL